MYVYVWVNVCLYVCIRVAMHPFLYIYILPTYVCILHVSGYLSLLYSRCPSYLPFKGVNLIAGGTTESMGRIFLQQ